MSLSLSVTEIAALRATAAQYRPDTCTIQRNTRTHDALGAWTDSWANLATGVACLLEQRSRSLYGGGEQVVNSAEALVEDYTLYLAWDQDITEKDRVVIGSTTFQVSATNNEQSWRTVTRCKLARIK